MKGPEAQIQSAILDCLAAHRVVAFRQNSGAVVSEYKGRTRMIRYGEKGMADILALPEVTGQFKGYSCKWTAPLFIEVKAEKGRQSAEQKSFERQVKDAGAEYVVVRSVDEIEQWLRGHGVIA